MDKKTVLGLFDRFEDATAAARDLTTSGFDRSDVDMLSAHHQGEFVRKGGTITPTQISRLGVPDGDSQAFAEAVRRGSTLVLVETDATRAAQAVEILERRGAMDLDHLTAYWRRSGWTGYEAAAKPYAHTDIERERTERIPVIEEQLKVGKREVQSASVRLFTRVIEKPVEATVNLREEKITVERHKVDRPATGAAWDSVREGEVTVTATSEQPVVAKESRVVEEVSVRKDVDMRTQTVRDTVRGTEVDVDRTPTKKR